MITPAALGDMQLVQEKPNDWIGCSWLVNHCSAYRARGFIDLQVLGSWLHLHIFDTYMMHRIIRFVFSKSTRKQINISAPAIERMTNFPPSKNATPPSFLICGRWLAMLLMSEVRFASCNLTAESFRATEKENDQALRRNSACMLINTHLHVNFGTYTHGLNQSGSLTASHKWLVADSRQRLRISDQGRPHAWNNLRRLHWPGITNEGSFQSRCPPWAIMMMVPAQAMFKRSSYISRVL